MSHPGEALSGQEQRPNLLGWQISERLVVGLWDEQHVARQNGPVIQKGQARVVLVDAAAGNAVGDDLVEDALLHWMPLRRPIAPVRISADST